MRAPFWQFWSFFCRPTLFVGPDSGVGAPSELDFHRDYYALELFVGKWRPTTICNCTWGCFYKCVVSSSNTIARTLMHTKRAQNRWKLFPNIVSSHFCLLEVIGCIMMHLCSTDPCVRFAFIQAHKTWPQQMDIKWFGLSRNMSGLTVLKKSD